VTNSVEDKGYFRKRRRRRRTKIRKKEEHKKMGRANAREI